MIKSKNVKNTKLLRCINKANLLLQNPSFYKEIKKHTENFDMSGVNGNYIAKTMKDSKLLVCEVVEYRKRWSRANAYFLPSKPNRIHINTAKLNRSDGSVVATIIHEWVHLVDKHDRKESYGHGDNSSKGKMNTAPYWIDNVAENMIDKKDGSNNESHRIITKRWWHKFLFWR